MGLKRIFILNIILLLLFTSCRKQGENSNNINIQSILHQAEISYRDNNYEKVIALSEKLLSSKQVGKEADSIRANALILKSIANNKQGNHTLAIRSCSKALDLRLKLYGEKHTYLISVYNNLGNVYSDLGEYQKAITFYEEALSCKGVESRRASNIITILAKTIVK